MISNDDDWAFPRKMAIGVRRRDVLLASAATFLPRVNLGFEHAVGTRDVPGKVCLSVENAIETTRAMSDSRKAVIASPSGDRYAFMTITGDVARDGVHAVVYVGCTTSMAEAAPIAVARLFTRSLGRQGRLTGVGGVSQLSMTGQNVPTWIDDENLALRWEADDGGMQVFRIDLARSNTIKVTKHREDVVSYSFGADLSLIFEATASEEIRTASQRQLEEGFAVSSESVEGLLGGFPSAVDTTALVGGFERFWIRRGTTARKVEGIASYSYVSSATRKIGASRISPNGNVALIDGSPLKVPESWAKYSDPVLQRTLDEHRSNPRDAYARELQQLYVLDMLTGRTNPLWDAPVSSAGAGAAYQLSAASWSLDSSRVLLGWTFLPTSSSGKAGLEGRAIAEIDIATGEFWPVPLEIDYGNQLTKLAWKSGDVIEVTLTDEQSVVFKKTWGIWRKLPTRQVTIARSKPPIRVELRESFDRPPSLVALKESNGEEQPLLDLNPQLNDLQLGRVEFINWPDHKHRRREARFYHPVANTVNGEYPLVVQTSGYAPRDEFSLYGSGGSMGLGPNAYATNIAQLIANRGIGVLQVSFGPHHTADTAEAANEWAAMIESGIEYLAQRGSVAREKVGLMGFSIAGRYAEHALAFSEFPYAAAAICDHADVNYLQSAIFSWETWRSDWYGGPPFGASLSSWLSQAPSFNVERIRAPIQYSICDHSLGNSSVLWPWEMFSRLRYLKKPVEYYVVPDIQRGSHNLQNPRQIRALQTRVLDWWLFWLKNEEDPELSKQEQYGSWRRLRQLQIEDSRTSRAPLYKWNAEAVST